MDKEEKAHADKLTGIYGEVEICGLKYGAGYALYEIDYTAFRCSMADMEEEED